MKFSILFVTIFVAFANCAEEFPASIQRCKYEDEACLVGLWNKYAKLADANGIGELGVHETHQIHLNKQEAQIGSETFSINAKVVFTNINVTGFGDATFQQVSGFKRDPKTITQLEIKGSMPYMAFNGHYEATGRLLLVPLTGSGDGQTDYYNVKFHITANTQTEVIDGEEYLKIVKVHCDYTNERNHFRFDNFLNNAELSKNVNAIFNDNQEVFGQEVNPSTALSLAKIFKRVLSATFKKYPYRSFFLE
jgi:hypothetical protein